jgi:hypothetical protein
MTLGRSLGRHRTTDVPSGLGWAGEARMREEEPESIEIHNHIAEPDYNSLTSEQMDRRHRDDEPDEDGEVVARFPASFHMQTEGDEIVVYSRPPRSQRSDILDIKVDDRSRRAARDQHPPRTVAELNRFFAGYYPRKKTTAAR